MLAATLGFGTASAFGGAKTGAVAGTEITVASDGTGRTETDGAETDGAETDDAETDDAETDGAGRAKTGAAATGNAGAAGRGNSGAAGGGGTRAGATPAAARHGEAAVRVCQLRGDFEIQNPAAPSATSATPNRALRPRCPLAGASDKVSSRRVAGGAASTTIDARSGAIVTTEGGGVECRSVARCSRG